jgi:hypothetical protein
MKLLKEAIHLLFNIVLTIFFFFVCLTIVRAVLGHDSFMALTKLEILFISWGCACVSIVSTQYILHLIYPRK